MRPLILALALSLPIPAGAQDAATETAPEAPAAQETDPSRFTDAPFEPKLLRLVEVLGSVQFLRQLCDPDEETVWRERAAELIAAEGDTAPRKTRLTAAFNRGYRAFSSYTSCTDSAIYAIDRYMREGESLSRDVLVRYGN